METPDPSAKPDADEVTALTARAEARQRAYAKSRREWAEAVGRPYDRKSDPRPPPGEVDAPPDEQG